MTTRDIQEIVHELYGVDVSATLVSEITADLDAEVTAWQTRPIEAVWPIVYFDGIVVHVRGGNGRVSQHTIYVALGVNLEGRKELLGLWLSENEGAKFWLACLTDLKNRGLSDIFLACIDGLSGFPEAIHAAYPATSVQLCIVHLVRAALRYVSSEDSKQVIRDLEKIDQAATVLGAEQALDEFAQAWDAKYPTIAKQWRVKWTDITVFTDFAIANGDYFTFHWFFGCGIRDDNTTGCGAFLVQSAYDYTVMKGTNTHRFKSPIVNIVNKIKYFSAKLALYKVEC